MADTASRDAARNQAGAARAARPDPAAQTVVVHGSGAVGLSAALALARQGLAVTLIGPPPAAPGEGDIRAYALNAASRALLEELRVWDAIPPDARTPVLDMHIEGDAPGAALDFSAWQQRSEALAWIVDAAELESALHTAARFAPHLRLLPPDATAPLAALRLHAEGRDSAARTALGVQLERRAYGQRAIAARLQADQPHGGLARQWFRSPDVLALLPMDRPEAGRGLALVWSLPEERAEALMPLDDAGFEAALMDATAGAAGTLRLVGRRAAWPLALAQADPMCGPGWALIGDAAHVVHPLAGQGLNLGLADVAVLAQVIAAREPWRALGDVRLLQRYARERAGATRLMGGLTDGLLHLFAHPLPLVRHLRNQGLGLVNRLPMLKRALADQALAARLKPGTPPPAAGR
jgi:2-polyprenyl-6-methoxyphenol hydroxylase-like FAD-dependent oxidoreductase